MSNGAEDCDGEIGLFMLAVGGNAVGAWVLLVIAIIGLVGMDAVGKEHAEHSQEGLATQHPVRGWEHS